MPTIEKTRGKTTVKPPPRETKPNQKIEDYPLFRIFDIALAGEIIRDINIKQYEMPNDVDFVKEL